MKKKTCIAIVCLTLVIILSGAFHHIPVLRNTDDDTPKGNNYMEYSLRIDSVGSRCMG